MAARLAVLAEPRICFCCRCFFLLFFFFSPTNLGGYLADCKPNFTTRCLPGPATKPLLVAPFNMKVISRIYYSGMRMDFSYVLYSPILL